MDKIKLVTDSNSDLTDEMIREYDITVVPQYVNFEGCSYKDRVEITSADVYKKVSEINKLPKTSAPSPSDFHNAFKPIIDAGDNILCICSSSLISSTYQNAVIAAGEFPEGRIEIVNSMNISMGIGILVLSAIDYINEGLDIHQTAKILRGKVAKVKTTFIIDTLDYMRKGGRCTAIESFMGNILKIRPVLGVVNGKLTLLKKMRGRRQKALMELLDTVLHDKDSIDPKRIVLTHSTSDSDAEYMKNEIHKIFKDAQVLITETGCSVSSHCGPNTISVIYLLK